MQASDDWIQRVVPTLDQCVIAYLDPRPPVTSLDRIAPQLQKLANYTNRTIEILSAGEAEICDGKAGFIRTLSPNMNMGRSKLLLCGAYLEHQITSVALLALAHGFDVHLLCDCIVPYEPRLRPTHLMRLSQAGVVPTSLRQSLYMWQTVERHELLRKQLAKCLVDLQRGG